MAEPLEDDPGTGRDLPARDSAEDEEAAANAWPAGWPRLYPERSAEVWGEGGPSRATQRVTFVGGGADGLSDRVAEAAPGRLPRDVETMGSVYRLVEAFEDDEPTYHWHGFEDH